MLILVSVILAQFLGWYYTTITINDPFNGRWVAVLPWLQDSTSPVEVCLVSKLLEWAKHRLYKPAKFHTLLSTHLATSVLQSANKMLEVSAVVGPLYMWMVMELQSIHFHVCFNCVPYLYTVMPLLSLGILYHMHCECQKEYVLLFLCYKILCTKQL